MNSILRLRTDDFEIQTGTKGPILCNGIKGMSLVMFYSPMCKICERLLPMFNRLPQIISGCKFCILNINENQQIIAMSKQTIAPIEFVPHICFSVNGRPCLLYDDDPTLEKLVAFVQYAMKLIGEKKSFIDKGAKVESDIPKYSIARPYADFKCDEAGQCFLTYSEAYKGSTAQMGNSGHSQGGVMEQSPSQYFQRT